MTSQPSASSPPDATSRAFDLLAEPVRRWVYDQGWQTLRDAQEAAIPLLLEGTSDVIIAAATAAGKTEAAFLPICSRLAAGPAAPGVQVLYVAPLKALINDQHERLSGLCERLDIPVHRWHGDVPGSRKSAVLKKPGGILLITPESLEALFVVRGPALGALLAGLQYVVVDELHAFLGTERGAQLRSLMHRVELTLRRRVPRIGLSATLGDMSLAAGALRPGQAGRVRVIESASGGQELAVQVRGYLDSAGPVAGEEDDGEAPVRQIAQDLFQVLRGQHNLVFANARTSVERLAARLRDLSDAAAVPNEFLPHHGNLSRELREDAEAALKGAAPATAVATTTLEMGIDIGSVHSVAQVGAPPSVAALRQRLGRSGRRPGEPAILRMYVTEPSVDSRTPLADQLRAELVQGIAMLNLLIDGWCEPPAHDALHLSTLVQQVLSAIAQHGGVTVPAAYRALCGPGSPFTAVTQAQFAALLRSLAANDVIVQADDGTLLLGATGERTVNHYTFYAAFSSPDEYRLLVNGRPLGTIPADQALFPDALLIFGGRRWKVTAVDHTQKIIEVIPAAGGRPPAFTGGGGTVHDRVRTEMRAVLATGSLPRYLSPAAAALLGEARSAYTRYRLAEHSAVRAGQDVVLFPWAGSRATQTLAAQLTTTGLEASNDGLVITVQKTDPGQVRENLGALAAAGPADPVALASKMENKESAKYDDWLEDSLLSADYARRALDCPGAWRQAGAMLRSWPSEL